MKGKDWFNKLEFAALVTTLVPLHPLVKLLGVES